MEAFIKDFEENGPGSVGPELDRGFKLMEPYGQKMYIHENRRIELGNKYAINSINLQHFPYSLHSTQILIIIN